MHSVGLVKQESEAFKTMQVGVCLERKRESPDDLHRPLRSLSQHLRDGRVAQNKHLTNRIVAPVSAVTYSLVFFGGERALPPVRWRRPGPSPVMEQSLIKLSLSVSGSLAKSRNSAFIAQCHK